MNGGEVMSGTTIIFGNKRPVAIPKQSNENMKPSNNQKPRKKRSDAKHDIKLKLSSSDKKILKLKAADHNLSLTAFNSMIVKKELLNDWEYDLFDYDNNGQFVHVMLEKDFFEMIKTLSIEWDISIRKVAHRIIKNYIFRSKGGIKIIDHSKRGDHQ